MMKQQEGQWWIGTEKGQADFAIAHHW